MREVIAEVKKPVNPALQSKQANTKIQSCLPEEGSEVTVFDIYIYIYINTGACRKYCGSHNDSPNDPSDSKNIVPTWYIAGKNWHSKICGHMIQ